MLKSRKLASCGREVDKGKEAVDGANPHRTESYGTSRCHQSSSGGEESWHMTIDQPATVDVPEPPQELLSYMHEPLKAGPLGDLPASGLGVA